MNKNTSSLPRALWLAFAAAFALAAAVALAPAARAQEETEGGAPAALETTIWDPATARAFTYTSGTLNPTLVVTLVGTTGNVSYTSAYVMIYNPATGANDPFVAGVRAGPLFPGISNSAVITAAGFPLYKAVGSDRMRIQFFIAPEAGGFPLGSPVHTIWVEPVKAYVPIVYRDFTPGFNVSGRIVTGIATGVSGVWVQTTQGRSAASDSDGYYTIPSVPPGPTTLTPQASNAGFIPPALGVTVTQALTGQNFVWKDDNPCRAIDVLPNVPYYVWSYDAFDFLRLNLPANLTSTVIMTISEVWGAGQLQFRSPAINADCSPITSTNRIDPFAAFTGGGQWAVLRYYGVRPNVYYARWGGTNGAVPTDRYQFSWSYIPGTNPYEPNNNSCEAAPINFGDTHFAFPEDAEDWYQFDLAATSNVQITVTNYVATGQYQVWRQIGTCSQLNPSPPLAIAGGSPGLVTMSMANLQAGRYFFRIATVGNFNAGTPYSFRIVTGGSAVAKIDTCNPPGQPNCERQSGSNATIFWFDMVGVSSLTLRLDGQNISGGTCLGQAVGKVYGPVTISNPASTGSYTFSGVATGYYAAGGQWSPPAGSGDSKPLKMNCTLLNAFPSFEPEAIGPQRPEVTIVNPTFYPELTPIPLPSQPDAAPGQVLPSLDVTPMP